MSPITTQLDKFVLFWGQVPLLKDVFVYEKLVQVLENYQKPEITDEEYSKITGFPFEQIKYNCRLAFQVKNEIDLNVISIETDAQLKRYLKSIDDKLYDIMTSIKHLNFIDELKRNGHIILRLQGGNAREIEKISLVTEFLIAHLSNYQNYQIVQSHVISMQFDNGFISADDKASKELEMLSEGIYDQNAVRQVKANQNALNKKATIEIAKPIPLNAPEYIISPLRIPDHTDPPFRPS